MPSRPLLQPSAADTDCIKKFIPQFQSEWYITSIDVVGKHLSGLILIKTLDDHSQRMVFTNEAGVKFFDFGFDTGGNFTVFHILKNLNKKAVIHTFKKDFELMLMTKAKRGNAIARASDNELKFIFNEGKEADYIVTSPDCTQLIRLEKWGRKKRMTQITFEGQAIAPETIQIQHFNFDMTIKMKKIIR